MGWLQTKQPPLPPGHHKLTQTCFAMIVHLHMSLSSSAAPVADIARDTLECVEGVRRLEKDKINNWDSLVLILLPTHCAPSFVHWLIE